MKTLFKLSTSIALFMVFSSQVLAEEALKIGAVQVLKVLEQSPQYQAAGKALDKEFEARSKTLIAEQKKIKGLEDKLSKDRAIMSEAEVGKLERDVLNKKIHPRTTIIICVQFLTTTTTFSNSMPPSIGMSFNLGCLNHSNSNNRAVSTFEFLVFLVVVVE